MRVQGLLQNRRFVLAIILMLVFLLAILISEIATAGRPETTKVISDIGAIACALIAVVLYVWAWTTMSASKVSRQVWGLVTLGLLLWATAEAIWAFYELVLNIETPYPSVADLFWLVGYIPLYLALLIRYRSFQAIPSTTRQRWIVLVFIALYSSLLILYVIKPILESFDPTRLLESLVNIAYPLADWGLLILALVIIFSLEAGRFSMVWRLFGAGLILTTTADIFFFYATWNEFYYPGGQLNAISGLLDTLYNLSYLTLGLAVFAYVLIAGSISTPGINIVLRSLAKINILVFIKPDGRILSLSDNFLNLVRATTKSPYVGMDLAKALGIEAGQAEELLKKTIEQGALTNHRLTIKDVNGQAREVLLTSLAIRNEENRIDSIALILRMDALPEGETEKPLKQDQKMLIDYYLNKAGTSRVDEKQALRAYFLEQMNLLYSIVEQFSGAKAAENLLLHLHRMARENLWQFSYVGKDIAIPEEFEGQALADLLLALLRAAKRYTANVTELRMVEQEMMSLDKNLGPETRSFIDKYNFHGALQTAA